MPTAGEEVWDDVDGATMITVLLIIQLQLPVIGYEGNFMGLTAYVAYTNNASERFR